MTFNNHIKSLFFLLLSTALYMVTFIYFRFETDLIKFLGIFYLADAIPALSLHFVYWLKNKDEEYEIRDSGIIMRKHGKEILYLNQDIEKIVVHLSASRYQDSSFQRLSISSYHYAKIRLKTGEELIITCLLTPRVDKALSQLKGVLLERKKTFFCAIK